MNKTNPNFLFHIIKFYMIDKNNNYNKNIN